MCDPSYDGIDEITDDSSPAYTPIEYEPITYPDDPPLPFTALTQRASIDKVDQDQQNRIGMSANALEYAQNEAEQGYELAGNLADEEETSSDWTCKMISGGGIIGGIAQALCYAINVIFVLLSYAGVYVSYALVVATSYSSIGVGQAVEDYAQDIYYDMFDDRVWMYTSLNTINNNINDQNTQMLQDLQDRHEQMVNNINSHTDDDVNYLGCQIFEAMGGTCTTRRRLNSEGLPTVNLDVTWNWQGQAVSFMEMVGESVKAKIGDGFGCASKPRGKGNKKPKADKSGSNIFTNEDDGDENENRELMTDGYEALEAKLDDVYVSVADVKTDAVDMKDKINLIEGKMNMVEGKMNTFEDDIADIRGKVDAIEADVTDMKGKMDTIIEMMTQLLGQEKLVKEQEVWGEQKDVQAGRIQRLVQSDVRGNEVLDGWYDKHVNRRNRRICIIVFGSRKIHGLTMKPPTKRG